MAEPGEPLPRRASASMGTRKMFWLARAVEEVMAESVALPARLKPLRIWFWMVVRELLPIMRSWLVASRVVDGERVRVVTGKRMEGDCRAAAEEARVRVWASTWSRSAEKVLLVPVMM